MRDRNVKAAHENASTIWLALVLAVLLAALLSGCDSIFDDEQASPEFIYQCVDSQADYACVDPGYYDHVVHMGDGIVLQSVALGSQFNVVYGVKQSESEYGYYYHSPEEYAEVVSAYTARLSSGQPFTAVAPGLAPLIAVNGAGHAVDHMYVSVEPATELRLFPDGQSDSGSVGYLELTAGDSAILRGRVQNGASYLRGTPVFECSKGEGVSDPAESPVEVDCTVPGIVAITAVSEGTMTLQVSTGGATQAITLTVSPGSDAGGPDAGGIEDAGTNSDTDTHLADTGVEDDGGTDIQPETDNLPGTDTDFLDGGVGTDTDTLGLEDAGADMDGGPDGGDASVDNDAG